MELEVKILFSQYSCTYATKWKLDFGLFWELNQTPVAPESNTLLDQQTMQLPFTYFYNMYVILSMFVFLQYSLLMQTLGHMVIMSLVTLRTATVLGNKIERMMILIGLEIVVLHQHTQTQDHHMITQLAKVGIKQVYNFGSIQTSTKRNLSFACIFVSKPYTKGMMCIWICTPIWPKDFLIASIYIVFELGLSLLIMSQEKSLVISLQKYTYVIT